jgi:hypothetical protein
MNLILLTSNLQFCHAFLQHSSKYFNMEVVYDDLRVDVSNATSLSSLDVDRRMKDILSVDAYDFYMLYSMRKKMALPLLFDGSTIHSDDDMLVLRDPSYLGYSWASVSGLDRTSWSNANIILTNAISECCGIDWDPDISNAWCCDAGVQAFTQEDKEVYKDVMIRILSSKNVRNAYKNLGKNDFRLMDQRVLSVTAAIRGMRRLTSTYDYRAVPYKCPSKYCPKLPKSTWVHYCATSHKTAWLEFFESQMNVSSI